MTKIQHRLEHSWVFGGEGNNPDASPVTGTVGDAPEGEVAGLCRARGEHDLVVVGIDDGRHLGTSGAHGRRGFPFEGMIARVRVAELFREERQHGLTYERVDGSGGLVIEGDGSGVRSVQSQGSIVSESCPNSTPTPRSS